METTTSTPRVIKNFSMRLFVGAGYFLGIIVLLFLSALTWFGDHASAYWIQVYQIGHIISWVILGVIFSGLITLTTREIVNSTIAHDWMKARTSFHYLTWLTNLVFVLLINTIGYIIFLTTSRANWAHAHLILMLFFQLLIASGLSLLVHFVTLIFLNRKLIKRHKMMFLIINLLVNWFWTILFYLSWTTSWSTLLILFLLPIINDSSAYLVGSLWGRKKVATKISPNKTWLGLISGIIISFVFTTILLIVLVATTNATFKNIVGQLFLKSNYYQAVGPISVSLVWWISALVIIALLSVLATFGDLLFSKFKRILQIKDYSQLLGPHGGLLDRIDSSIVVFLSYFILTLLFEIGQF